MTDYNYQNGKFSDKDSLPSGDPAKIIKGQDFEDEFEPIEVAVNSKLNIANPNFTGTITGSNAVLTGNLTGLTNLTISGLFTAGTIDGGTF